MTQWSALLDQHTAAAAPRSFDGVLRRVRRRRQRQVVGAALGVLLVVGGAALAAGTSTTATPPPRPAASGSPLPGVGQPPASIVVDGKTLVRLGTRSLHVALVDDLSSTSVRFKVRGYPDDGDTYCGTTYRAFLLGQSADTVRVGLYGYGRDRRLTMGGCFGNGSDPEPSGLQDAVVPLGSQLGERTVTVDGTRGSLAVLQTDTLLRAPSLPARFTRLDETVGIAAGQRDPYDTYRWQSSGGLLSLTQGTVPAGTGVAHPDTTSSITVRGHEGAVLTQTQYDTTTRCLRWYEGRAIALCASGRTAASVDLLQSIATGLRSRTSAGDASAVPTAFDENGVRFQLLGDEAIEVVYAGPAPNELVVRGGKAFNLCRPVTRSYVLSEDSSSVRIGSYAYDAVHGTTGSCPAPPDGEQTLRLRAPLGARRIIAVTDFNRQVPVIDEHDFLTAGHLPTGYSGHSFAGGRTRLALGFARQSWAAEAGAVTLTLDEGPLPGEVRVLGSVVGHATAHGHTADVVQQRGTTYPVRCLRWSEGTRDEVQLCSHGGGQRHLLSDLELVRVADGLHRP